MDRTGSDTQDRRYRDGNYKIKEEYSSGSRRPLLCRHCVFGLVTLEKMQFTTENRIKKIKKILWTNFLLHLVSKKKNPKQTQNQLNKLP